MKKCACGEKIMSQSSFNELISKQARGIQILYDLNGVNKGDKSMSKSVLVIDTPNNCGECKLLFYCHKYDDTFQMNSRPDWCPLKQASEKGEPKKPLLIYGRMRCPNCKGNTRSLNLYCDCCGQRIDWSDCEMETTYYREFENDL